MKPASIWDWLGPFALMTAFIAFLIFSMPDKAGLCGGEENCLREWIAALSGWAAAIAAGATIGVLLRQLHLQQRQTDFQLGDALPTFDVILHEFMPTSPQILITNWNRRLVALRSIEVISPKAAVAVVEWHGGGTAMLRGSMVLINPACAIKGWIKRAKSPPRYSGNIAVAPAGDLPIIPWETIGIRFTYSLSGLPGEIVSEVPVHRAKLGTQAAGAMTMTGFNSGV